MSQEIYIQLEEKRKHLKQLGNKVANLSLNYPDIIDSSDLSFRLEKLRQVYEEAIVRLENPHFSIATLGTTSSGKSTMVNALIGRRIAPIEAGEMSGGVLSITHSKEFSLSVEETEGGEWETGIWSGLSEETIYDRIRNRIMLPYHQTRLKKECIAPQVTVSIPILPANDNTLLGLPEGIEVKFIDLPGLKSIQDKDNLKVIQKQVNKAFSIVTLDYLQVDDRHRKALLEELKRVVEYLQGRTDSMIFVLNRVDQRGKDDKPIEERIELLKSEIQETLNLNELPDIIPLSGRLLYYAQCAWGDVGINENSPIPEESRRQLLTGMLEDCATIIKQHTKEDKKLRNWFRDLEDNVCDRECISDDTMRKVLNYALEWSGGKELWNCLHDRVSKSFSELVILPALIEVFENYDSFVRAIDVELNIRRIGNKEELETKKKQIEESRENLDREVENICDRFHNNVEDIFNSLNTNNEAERSRLTQKISQLGYQGFESLFDTVREVENDLIENLICPVRDAFSEGKGVYELEEDLVNVVSPVKAKGIAKAYDLIGRKLLDFELDEDGDFIKSIRQDDPEGQRILEHGERSVRSLYFAMREAISTRAQFTLQGQAKEFENGLQCLVEAQKEELKYVCQQSLPELNLHEVIAADFQKDISESLPELPENIFDFSADIQQEDNTKTEVVGCREEEETYETGSCFKSEHTRTVTKDVYGDIDYRELRLPGAKNMARQWADGITKEKAKLWDILADWINNHLDSVSEEYNKTIENIINIAVKSFEEQLKSIESNSLQEIEQLDAFEEDINKITKLRQEIINS